MGPVTRDAILVGLMQLAKHLETTEQAFDSFGASSSEAERFAALERSYGRALYSWNVGNLGQLRDESVRMIALFRAAKDKAGTRAAIRLTRVARLAAREQGA
jgi:hypothetical protein